MLSRRGCECLPAYSRSLLKIKVPVTVTLATSKQSVGSILDLVPGSIIQFEKLCDEMLSLEVGDHRVAEGEAVKVGDKFGLRLTSMTLPEERFHTVRGTRAEGAPPGSAADRTNAWGSAAANYAAHRRCGRWFPRLLSLGVPGWIEQKPRRQLRWTRPAPGQIGVGTVAGDSCR